MSLRRLLTAPLSTPASLISWRWLRDRRHCRFPPLTGWCPAFCVSGSAIWSLRTVHARYANLSPRLAARAPCVLAWLTALSAYCAAAAFVALAGCCHVMLSLRCATRIDGICYYIWTDIFFGDMSNGRMNQFVPQLILGNALDGSSGAPAYKPKWGEHKSYSFGNTARTLQHHACMCHGLAHAGFPPHGC